MRTEKYYFGEHVIQEGAITIINDGESFQGHILMPPSDNRYYIAKGFWICSMSTLLGDGDSYPFEPSFAYRRSWKVSLDNMKYEGDGWLSTDCGVFPFIKLTGTAACGHRYKVYQEGVCKRCFDKRAQNLVMSTRLYDVITQPIYVRVFDKAEGKRFSAKIQLHITADRPGNVFTKLPKPPIGNFFDVRKGELSFSAKDVVYNKDDKWERKGRQVIKPSKLVAYLLGLAESDKSGQYGIALTVEGDNHPQCHNRFIEVMCDNVRVNKTMNIEVSRHPSSVYELDTSGLGVGSLGDSCMRPESSYGCKNKAKFYDDLSLEIAHVKDKHDCLKTRALIWRGCINEENNEEFVFMDRIYGTEKAISEMKLYAHENGWAHKVHQTYDNPAVIFPDGTETDMFFFPVSDIDPDDAPFLDTLCMWYRDTQRLVSNHHGRGGYNAHLQSTDGQMGDYHCCACESSVHEDDIYHINDGHYCGDCVVSHYQDDSYIPRADAVEFYYDRRYVWTWYDDSDIMRINGDNYHIDDLSYCDWSEEYFLEGVNHYECVGLDVHDDHVEDCMEERGFVLKDDEWVKVEKEVKS